MESGMFRFASSFTVAILALATVATTPATATIEVMGRQMTSVSWPAATGPVAGYEVYTSFNGAPETLYQSVTGKLPIVMIEGNYGDSVVVRVRAQNAAGAAGPMSDPSDAIVFVQAPAGGGPSTMPFTSYDFNGDHASDILIRNLSTGEMEIWLMHGPSVLARSRDLPGTGLVKNWNIVASGDLDGDGQADLALRAPDGTLGLWLTVDGEAVDGVAFNGLGLDWNVMGMPDVDGNGRSDILFQNDTGQAYVWMMDGLTILSIHGFPSRGAGFQVVGTKDLDGDGRDDVLWQDGSGALSAWMMNGTAIASQGAIGDPGPGWSVLATPDLDGDRKHDILFRHDDGSLFVWLLDGLRLTQYSPLGQPGGGWTVIASRDLNGDQHDDLLWQHTGGLLYAWMMKGFTTIGAGAVGSPGAAFSVITR